MGKLIAFLVVSAILIYISRASLRVPRSHGFFRFFAWEFITALIILKIDLWFVDPWSWHQVLSWILLVCSIIPLVFGVSALATRGNPDSQRQAEPHLLAFEKTTRLVTSGIYRYIRHPLYSSLLFLTWGVFLKGPDGIGLLLAAAATLSLVATARADEAECLRYFGSDYQQYIEHTRMFIPFVI